MGYYSGSGVTTGGGETIRLFGSWAQNGDASVHNVYQKTISTVTTKRGVQLSTAQAETSSLSLSHKTFSWASLVPWIGCKGTAKNVSYSQISDSNLYELVITNETYRVSDGTTAWE